MPRSWYEIKNAAAPEADVYLYDEIGGWGTTADQFIKDLNGVKSSTINLFVNSPGGDVFDGMAIHAALSRHPATINATVDGLAASSASFIIQAADRIVMSKGSTIMVHEPYGMTIGNATDMAKQAEVLDKMGDNIAEIYAARSGTPAADWRDAMRAESWYKADEAVAAGLADAVAKGKQAKVAALAGRVFNLAKFQHVPDWIPQTKNDMGDMCAMPGCDMAAAVEVPMCADCAAKAMGGDMQNRISNAEWDTNYINNLPDSAFAVIKPGGTKDDSGKTVPRSLRMLPHHSSSGAVDDAHLRNALSRLSQADLTPAERSKAQSHLDNHAEAEGIGQPAASVEGVELPGDFGWVFRESASYISPLEQLLKVEAERNGLTAGITSRQEEKK